MHLDFQFLTGDPAQVIAASDGMEMNLTMELPATDMLILPSMLIMSSVNSRRRCKARPVFLNTHPSIAAVAVLLFC